METFDKLDSTTKRPFSFSARSYRRRRMPWYNLCKKNSRRATRPNSSSRSEGRADVEDWTGLLQTIPYGIALSEVDDRKTGFGYRCMVKVIIQWDLLTRPLVLPQGAYGEYVVECHRL